MYTTWKQILCRCIWCQISPLISFSLQFPPMSVSNTGTEHSTIGERCGCTFPPLGLSPLLLAFGCSSFSYLKIYLVPPMYSRLVSPDTYWGQCVCTSCYDSVTQVPLLTQRRTPFSNFLTHVSCAYRRNWGSSSTLKRFACYHPCYISLGEIVYYTSCYKCVLKYHS